MALRWIESCGGYADVVDVRSFYGSGAVSGYSATAGRRGGPAFGMERSSYAVRKAIGANATTIILGMAVQWNEYTTSYDHELLGAYDGATLQCGVYLYSGDKIQIRCGTTVLATYEWTRANGIWYFIEFKTTIDGTTGSYEFRINGETILSGTNVDTQNTANAYADTFEWSFGNNGYTDGYICDLYGCDGTGTANNDFLGDVHIDYHVPAADSATHTGWTANTGDKYAALDEASSDGDTTYIYDDTTDEKYAATLATVSLDNIKGVKLKTRAKKDGAGDQTVTPFVRSGGTDYEQTSLALSTDYLWAEDLLETNPADSAAWESADINALEIGVKVG